MANTPGLDSILQVTISATPTTLGQLVSFSGPTGSNRAKIDTSGLTTAQETSIAGLPRWGTVSFVVNLDHSDATHAFLYASFLTTTIESWKITYADAGAATVAFSGYLTALDAGDATVDGIVTLSGTVQVTGALTITP